MKTNSRYISLVVIMVLACFSVNNALGQSRSRTGLSEQEDQKSKKFRVKRSAPEGFHRVDESALWVMGHSWYRTEKRGEWKKKAKTGIRGPLFQSEDKQCELLYGTFWEFQFYKNPTPPEKFYGFYYGEHLKHREGIMSFLLTINNGNDDFRFEDRVTVIGGEEARERFNADSVFLFDVPIEPLEQYGESYTHCTWMRTTKDKHAILDFLWFFTDEGVKRKDDYIHQLDGHVWYKKPRGNFARKAGFKYGQEYKRRAM